MALLPGAYISLPVVGSTAWLGRRGPGRPHFSLRREQGRPQDAVRTLQALVDIFDKSERVAEEDREVLRTAIHREVQRIDRLNDARIEGYWAFQWEKVKQTLSGGIDDRWFGFVTVVVFPTLFGLSILMMRWVWRWFHHFLVH